MSRAVRVAVFRPDDDRMADAVALLESLGAVVVPDPMLAVDPTGNVPREAGSDAGDGADRDVVVLTSKTGVELLESVPGDDKIAKVVKDGVASVESKIYGKHERAELVLQNLADWGTVKKDANGAAVLLHAGRVKDRLETARNESLQSTQVKRVLDQIDDWADDSTRYSRVKKKNGVWRLKLGVNTE